MGELIYQKKLITVECYYMGKTRPFYYIDDEANEHFKIQDKVDDEGDAEQGWFKVTYNDPRWEELSDERKEQILRSRQERRDAAHEREADPMAQYNYVTKMYGSGPPHQNWRPEIVDNRPRDEDGNILSERRRDADTVARGVRRGRNERNFRHKNTSNRQGDMTKSAARIEKDADEGNLKVKKFESEFIKRVIDARLKKNMKQKDLAALVNRTENDIKNFEKGDLPYNAGMKSFLLIKLNLSGTSIRTQSKSETSE